jgi:hypothetical protein
MKCRICSKQMVFVAEHGREVLGVKMKQILSVCWDCGRAVVEEYQQKEHCLGKRVVRMGRG